VLLVENLAFHDHCLAMPDERDMIPAQICHELVHLVEVVLQLVVNLRLGLVFFACRTRVSRRTRLVNK
jgi:hypothetical protein